MADTTASASIATPDQKAPAIRIGEVFRQSRKIFGDRFAIFSCIGIVSHAIEFPLNALCEWITNGDATSGFDILARLLFTMLSFSILARAQSVIHVSVFQIVSGRRFSIENAISATLRQSPFLVALFWLNFFYAWLGVVLFVVPGLIIICMYAIALPACVIEGIGPIKSMSRSALLTKGNRWRILEVIGLLSLGIGLVALVGLLAKQAGGPISPRLACLPVWAVITSFSSVAIAVLYARLRTAREGVDIDSVAPVFD
jgi:hypothetical protein